MEQVGLVNQSFALITNFSRKVAPVTGRAPGLVLPFNPDLKASAPLSGLTCMAPG